MGLIDAIKGGVQSLTTKKAPVAPARTPEAAPRMTPDQSRVTPGSALIQAAANWKDPVAESLRYEESRHNFLGYNEGDVSWKASFEANAPKAADALAQLPESSQGQYRAVMDFIKDDPRAQHALQNLLLSGKLTQSKDLEGKDLLSNLSRIKDQPMEGADPALLLADLVEEIDHPSNISQQMRPSCSVTVAQIMLAKENPAEYARIVSGLASPEGTVKLANGDEIQRVPDSMAGRTQSSTLFQAALIDYGNDFVGEGADTHREPGRRLYADGETTYVSRSDPTKTQKVGSGLNQDQAAQVYGALFDRSYDGVTFQAHAMSGKEAIAAAKDGMFEKLEQALAQGKSVPVSIEWEVKDENHRPTFGDGADHMLLVTKVEGGRVYFDNPHGNAQSMSVEDFKRRLQSLSLPR